MNNFEILTWPPDNLKKCTTLTDFITLGPHYSNYYKVNIGMPFYLYSYISCCYEKYYVSESTRDVELLKYLKSEQLFILS